MELLPLSVLAGVLTVLSPCVLPVLPVVLAGSAAEQSRRAPFIVIGSLAVSVVLFTLLLKATTALLGVPSNVWLIVSGGLIAFVGTSLAFPKIWDAISTRVGLQSAAGGLADRSANERGTTRSILLGASLGPVFASCSPTYGLILAVVLPANFAEGVANILAYTLGLSAVMLAVAYGGRSVTKRLGWATDPGGGFRRGLGAFLVIFGLLIATGTVRTIETWMIDRGLLGAVAIEQGMLDSVDEEPEADAADVNIPSFLQQAFPRTDWSKADPAIGQALSGGPPKDGIPAIDNPRFEPVASFEHPDDVQAILVQGQTEVKAYPYNILIWHEIVNDTVDGTPIAVTFCPLCGSAVVYERILPDGETTTFGVSGGLLESNMMMFDRTSETLWQQSTGRALAGEHFPHQLELHKFQLLTVGEIKAQFPEAVIQSDETGHVRDYSRNPYAGYDESESFYFRPSHVDERYPAKETFVAFRVDETSVAAPWLALEDGREYETKIDGTNVTIRKTNGELVISGPGGAEIPFSFEMWFSWAVQNDDGLVFDPRMQ
jgi:cytochrome c biogenesis protein CcdA